jgi:hypothetical protein
LVVDLKRQVSFRHPNAADLNRRRHGQRREDRDDGVLPVDGLDLVEQHADQAPKLLQIVRPGPSQVWGSSVNRCLRVGIVGGLESLSEAGTERSIVNGAAHL